MSSLCEIGVCWLIAGWARRLVEPLEAGDLLSDVASEDILVFSALLQLFGRDATNRSDEISRRGCCFLESLENKLRRVMRPARSLAGLVASFPGTCERESYRCRQLKLSASFV